MKVPVIFLAGKRYEYAPTLAAYQRFKELTGIDCMDAEAMRSVKNPVGTVMTLIWCVLSARHPEVTLDYVCQHLTLEAMLGFLESAGNMMQTATGSRPGLN